MTRYIQHGKLTYRLPDRYQQGIPTAHRSDYTQRSLPEQRPSPTQRLLLFGYLAMIATRTHGDK